MGVRTFGNVSKITTQPIGLDVGAGINTGDATATAAQILLNQTAYGPLGKITGSMPNNGGVIITPSAAQQAINTGYHDGTGHVNAITATAGNNAFFSNQFSITGSSGAGSGTTSSTTYTIIHQKTVNYGGVVRVKFGIQSGSAGTLAYGRVYKNGVAVGAERSTTLATEVVFTEDISFAVGDLLQIYCHGTSGVSCALVEVVLSLNETPYFT